LRTYTLVGLGAALFMIISKYGFFDVLEPRTAAVGAAAGASLPLLALATTVAYFVVVFGLAPLARRLPASPYAPSAVRVVYEDGRGILRQILALSTSRDFKVADVDIDRAEGVHEGHAGAVGVALEVHGPGSIAVSSSRR
jgi:putative Mg2+ transporter-C (MgtC) family protein